MTDNLHPEDAHNLDRWLDGQIDKLQTNLEALLDVDAGLKDVQLSARQDSVTHALDAVIDVNAGLESIIGPSQTARSTLRDIDTPGDDVATSASPLLSATKAYAVRLANSSPHERLAARSQISAQDLRSMEEAALSLERANDIATAHNLDLARESTLGAARDAAGALARELDYACGLNRELARALIRTRDLALALILDRDLDLMLDRAKELLRDVDLMHDLAINRVPEPDLHRSLESALAHARNLVRERTLIRDLRVDREHARELAHTRAFDLISALIRNNENSDIDLTNALQEDVDQYRGTSPLIDFSSEFSASVGTIKTALRDFIGSDLSPIDLEGLSMQVLHGLRWSNATRWPPGWTEPIRQASVDLKDGTFEIISNPGFRDRISQWAPH